jgi:hypothetical protein
MNTVPDNDYLTAPTGEFVNLDLKKLERLVETETSKYNQTIAALGLSIAEASLTIKRFEEIFNILPKTKDFHILKYFKNKPHEKD